MLSCADDSSSRSLSISTSRAPLRARLAALLSAAALVAVASPAAAEAPLPPSPDLAPLPELVQPVMERRSSTMMISGVSLVAIGAVFTTVGGVFILAAHNGPPGSEDNGDEQRFKGLMIGAVGLGTSFAGIPLWVIGGASVPAKATLSVGAGGASLGGSF